MVSGSIGQGFQHIRLSVDGPIAELSLARPEARNAMTEAMGLEITSAVQRLNAEPSVRAVIVRGEGKAFCAGGDLAFLEQRVADTAEGNRAAMLRFYGLYLCIRDLRAPTIALLQGSAMGAGLCFALACDLRVASADARMALNFVKLGLHPGMGATYLVPSLAGPAVAADLLLTGRTIDAAEAQRLGLVSQLCAPEALEARGRALADELARSGPLAVSRCKRSLLVGGQASLAAALEAEAAAQAADYATAVLAEGVRAARERRSPVFTGE
jgi:enoyl-CoA hydratase/carnithine racemase